jgi:glycerol-3-phosphate acyltransferase PlsY
MSMVYIILSAVLGYLLGSVNTSLIVGRFHGVDIREHGSGNAGLNNVLRTLGKTAALLVLAGDVLKGLMSCMAGMYIAGDAGKIIAGTAAVIGHNWPLYFGFRGGKGALTSIAVVFFVDWRIGLVLTGIFVVVVLITRYVSLGSIIGAVAFPIAALILKKDVLFVVFALLFCTIVVARHHSNIKRLINGTESKLGAGKMNREDVH